MSFIMILYQQLPPAFITRKTHLIPIYMQRTLVLTTMFCIPLVVLQFYAEPIFRLLDQTEHVAKLGGVYVKTLLPQFFMGKQRFS